MTQKFNTMKSLKYTEVKKNFFNQKLIGIPTKWL